MSRSRTRPNPSAAVPDREVVLRIAATPDERRVLRSALLAARASELAGLQRWRGRLSFGYGSDSTREGMSEDVERLRLRHEMLDRLIAALEAEGPDTSA
jgi:hypothetical protein